MMNDIVEEIATFVDHYKPADDGTVLLLGGTIRDLFGGKANPAPPTYDAALIKKCMDAARKHSLLTTKTGMERQVAIMAKVLEAAGFVPADGVT